MIVFQIKRMLRMGLKSLWLHRLRSSLTVLGIMFGVCSVVAMLAIGTGAGEEAQEQIRRLGSHNIIIQSVKPPDAHEQTEGMMVRYGLTWADADLITTTVPGISRAVTARRVRGTVIRGNRRMDADLVGTSPDYLAVNNMTVVQGRFLTDEDMAGKSDACVLGRRVAERLFPLGDAVGSVIRRGNLRFRVVGVVTSMPRGEAGAELEGDPSSEVYIPMSTMQSRFGANIIHRTAGTQTAERVELHDLIIQGESLDHVRSIERVVSHILGSRRSSEDYQIIVPLHLLVQARRTRFIFNVVLGSIAAISLLVGGIGIMNITLASVMERTREIGIRRAMGAKKRHIILQFLTETLLLALFGGTMGVIIGVLVPTLVEHFAGMRTIVTMWSLMLAFGISAAVGLGFGIYPAYRAATMDPIQALRHE